jgi:hypothetical protein
MDPAMASLLSQLLRSSIEEGTEATYSTGFKSLSEFAVPRGLCPLPVDGVTLCGWACDKGRKVKPKTISKYISGIRYTHLTHGLNWPFTNSPILRMTMRALRKRWPDTDVMHKVPLTLDLLLAICRAMPGWPNLDALSWADLTWASASAVAFFAALRGGEFFVYPKSTRLVLLKSDVKVLKNRTGEYVKIDIGRPKTRTHMASEPAFAGSPGRNHEFDPATLYKFMDAKRTRLFPSSISRSATCPAFCQIDGTPITRAFMVGKANTMCRRAGINVFDDEGNRIPISAASWRAGYANSARAAKVDPLTIRAVGRWASADGPIPYIFDTTEEIQRASSKIVLSYTDISSMRTSSYAGGRFASSAIFESRER